MNKALTTKPSRHCLEIVMVQNNLEASHKATVKATITLMMSQILAVSEAMMNQLTIMRSA